MKESEQVQRLKESKMEQRQKESDWSPKGSTLKEQDVQ
jgi:hypothetical protein